MTKGDFNGFGRYTYGPNDEQFIGYFDGSVEKQPQVRADTPGLYFKGNELLKYGIYAESSKI